MSAKPRPRLAEIPEEDQPQQVSDLWTDAQSVKSVKVDWLLNGRLAFGTLAMLDGQKGTGKSSLAAALAALITAGVKIPGSRKMKPADVLWLTREEVFARDVRPRLVAAGADLKRVHSPKPDALGVIPLLSFPSQAKAIQDAIVHYGCRLVVLDPLSSHLDAGLDHGQEGSMRPVLEGIALLASTLGCLILATRHLKKDRACGRIDQGLGSVAISNVARSVLSLDQPDARLPRRVLRVIAINMGERAGPLEYDLVPEGECVKCVKWKELSIAADDPDADQLDKGERSVRETARQLLRLLLADAWVASKTVIAEAESCGVGTRTLHAAKGELGVRSRRVGTASPAYWEWGPPKGGWPTP